MKNTIFLPSAVEKVIIWLEEKGYETYVVGGSIRDALLGRKAQDWDLATRALPERMKQILEPKARIIPIGIRHGTIRAMVDGEELEITTFRTEGRYSDGRHPDTVEFSQDIKEDLKRRDFTVNAMAYHPTRGFIDLFGGRIDLKNRVLRCVGKPEKRFEEDALRILRALRFASQLQFQLHPDTAKQVIACRSNLVQISSERISQEFFRLLCGPDAAVVMETYLTVVYTFLPYLEKNSKIENLEVLNDLPELPLRLAALFICCGCRKEEVYCAAKELKWEKKLRDTVVFLVEHAGIEWIPKRENVHLKMAQWGTDLFEKWMILERSFARVIGNGIRMEELEYIQCIANQLQAEGACLKIEQLKINGKDLLDLGIPTGPQMGEIIKKLWQLVIEKKSMNEKQVLLKWAQKIWEQKRSD